MFNGELIHKLEQNTVFRYFFSSIQRHMILTVLFIFLAFTVVSCVGTYQISTHIVHTMTAERMDSDLNCLLESLGGRVWSNREGKLYCGDNYYGDGTEKEAQLGKFLRFEELTNTFCYTFIVDNDAKLGSVDATKTRLAYSQGHFLRVAGSTLSPDGTSIVGTYMTKNVSDMLDTQGRYQGIANVDGGLIYCIYETLKDADGNTVGAVVVGRNLNIINQQIWEYTIYLLTTIFIIIIPLGFMVRGMIRYIITNVTAINNYIRAIDGYDFPAYELNVDGIDEFHDIGENINKMVDKIRMSDNYRFLAETDPLTGMHNRLYISYMYEKIRKTVIEENMPFCIEIIDVDFFKQFNDNYGHQAGDDCIKMIADVLNSVADEDCIFASRWGGDEFLMMYVGYDKKAVFSIQKQLYNIIHKIAMEHAYSKVNDIVTITQGAYVSDDIADKSFADIFAEADKVLYALKETKRDSYGVNDLKCFC